MICESVLVECKREYTPAIIKTVVAFSNTNGGTVYIGVDDAGTVVGVEDADSVMLQLSNAVRDSIQPDVTLFVEYHQHVIEGKTVITAEVQKGTSCPYYLSAKGIRPCGVFVRQGASTVPATETAILRMIKETDGERYEQVRSLNQELTFIEAAKEFKKRNIPFGVNQQKTLALINADGMYTNLALLLSDQCVHTIKCAVYEGGVQAQFKDRREFTGSLLTQLADSFEFIDRYNRNRSKIDGLYRIDRRDYPVESVREALLNALVHRDYSFSDSTLISIFDDRIEFVSIGGLVRGITISDILLGISVARNRDLANVFYRLTLIEAYGTGIPKIMRDYSQYPVEPRIEATDNAFKITLPNRNELEEKPPLGANERIVLDIFKNKDAIVRKDVEAALDISQAMAVRVIKGLVDTGVIRTVGGGRNTRYVLAKEAP